MTEISPALLLDELWGDERLTQALDLLTDRARSPIRGLMFGYVPHRGNLLAYGPNQILRDLGDVVLVSEELPEEDDLALAAGRLGQVAMASEPIATLVGDILGDEPPAYGLEVVLLRHAAIVFAEDPWAVTDEYADPTEAQARLRQSQICTVVPRPTGSHHARLARIDGLRADWEVFANLQSAALQILESGGRGRLVAPTGDDLLDLLATR